MTAARCRWLIALLGTIMACGAAIWATALRVAGPPILAAQPPRVGKSGKDVPTSEQLQQASQRPERPTRASARVYKTQIVPHWFQNNTRFWYRNDLRGGVKEFTVVDVERGNRTAAFDHQKLAAALSQAAGVPYQADRLPFDTLEFVENSKAIRFRVSDTTWKCELGSYECSRTAAGSIATPPPANAAPAAAKPEALNPLESPWPDGLVPESEEPPQPQQDQRRGPRQQSRDRSPRSADGKWTAFVQNHNVFVRCEDDGKEFPLSQDGKPDVAYGMLRWAPDSQSLVAFRIDPGDRKEVYLIESSPPEGGRAKLHTRPYALPGDKLPSYELNIFDIAQRKQIKPEVDRIDLDAPHLHWKKDGHTFAYPQTDRGHQRFRLIEVDAHTCTSRNLIDEKTKTFVWTAHTENVHLNFVNWLEKTEEIVYASERDGWRHLYLIDAQTGKLKNPITHGAYVVRGIDRIDEENRQVWFQASGKNPGQDPYLIHSYWVNFDGTNLVALTEGNGNHSIRYSPDRKYLIDSYSRVDMAPVHELRRVTDGKLMCELERADITELQASGWEPPEVFVAKGRDGTTDIWGIICRPAHLDPSKKYPVIEYIYAGPQGSFVPKTFSPARRFAALTDLGFIVVQIDGMGTANRSKAFHDVCWKNLKDAGFPDRILWHRAAAGKYSYYNTDRVGIYGVSAGGQNSTGALVFHPDFYKVAVSACGCHDNRMDKASWNEQWMGYPVGPQYAACSNITNASKLQGKLLLIVGEMDRNVPPESTLRLVDALIKAGKDFELLVIPGAGHGMGGAYGDHRLQDFLVRHLREPVRS